MARGNCIIDVAGRKLNLVFRTNEVCLLEEAYNLGIGEILVAENFGLRLLRELVFVGSRRAHQRMTRDAVGDLLDELLLEDVQRILTDVVGAFSEAMPKARASNGTSEHPTLGVSTLTASSETPPL